MKRAKKENHNYEYFDKCIAKANSMVNAKYGNALLRFFCHLTVKGRKFPVLIQSRCSVSVGENTRDFHNNELTDINAFEETTIKQGVKRLLDEHVKNLSKVFEVAKMCK